MPMTAIAEAILRVEYKLDLLLKHLKVSTKPMHFADYCSVCKRTVDYQIDIAKGIVVRKCDCSTGKQPPLIPLVPGPVPQGVSNAHQPFPQPDVEPERDEAGNKRKAR